MKETNNQEKKRLDALKSYSEKPKYSMPEETPTLIERAKRWLRTAKNTLGATFFLFIVLPMMMITLFIVKHFLKTDIRNL